jgi:acetyl esterase/lipase
MTRSHQFSPDTATAVNCIPDVRRHLANLTVAVVAAMAIAACSSGPPDETGRVIASTESTTAPPPNATATTPEVTPITTSQTSTTAPPSTASPTSPETTPVDQISTTAATEQVSAGIRYLEPAFHVDVQHDVLYGTAPTPDGSNGVVELRLDLYAPRDDTESSRPVFIYSHGGSFVGGDKDEGIEWATRMAELGYVAASINYRLGPLAVSAPLDQYEQAQIDRARNDLQAAVRWFKANATVLGIDPDRISLGGYSAGAIMSAGATARWNDPVNGSNPEFSSAVCGAMSIAGTLNPAYVDPGDAGVIFHHGTLDDTVPFAYAVAARDALVNAGLPVEWHEYPGEGHGFSGDSLATIETTSVQWLYDHVATAPYPCSPAVAGGVPAP